MTKDELESLSDMTLDEIINIVCMADKYMKLYNIVQGERKNFDRERNLLDKFKRCISKNLVEAP